MSRVAMAAARSADEPVTRSRICFRLTAFKISTCSNALFAGPPGTMFVYALGVQLTAEPDAAWVALYANDPRLGFI